MTSYVPHHSRIQGQSTTTTKPATANALPFEIPVPVEVTNIKGGTIDNVDIDDGVRYSMALPHYNLEPPNVIDSNRRLYNEIPVSYSKPRFKFPRIRFGRDVK